MIIPSPLSICRHKYHAKKAASACQVPTLDGELQVTMPCQFALRTTEICETNYLASTSISTRSSEFPRHYQLDTHLLITPEHHLQPTTTSTMSLNFNHEELTALSEDVFSALDGVLDTTGPGVARLALTSISMLRFIETAVVDTTAKELSAMEELRRLQRSELQAAKDREGSLNKIIDSAVQTLVVNVAKAVCKFKHDVGDGVRKLEGRERKGEELDERLRVWRETQEHTRALLQEEVVLPSVEYVGFVLEDFGCRADIAIDLIPTERLPP